MSTIDPSRRPVRSVHATTVGVLAALALGSLGLTACGSSSPKPTNAASTSNTSASTSSSQTSAGGPAVQAGSKAGTVTHPRFGAVRECLQKNGITLPNPAGGPNRYPGAGIFLNRQLPKGVTRAQFQAALQKCAPDHGHFLRQGSPGFRNPAFKQVLAKFATCLRQNGVNVPTPNTSGNGPIFSTKGINTASPQFKAATAKCRGALLGTFRAGVRPHPGG